MLAAHLPVHCSLLRYFDLLRIESNIQSHPLFTSTQGHFDRLSDHMLLSDLNSQRPHNAQGIAGGTLSLPKCSVTVCYSVTIYCLVTAYHSLLATSNSPPTSTGLHFHVNQTARHWRTYPQHATRTHPG